LSAGKAGPGHRPAEPENIELTPAQLDRLFPFHLALDRNLRIAQAGRSLLRACPDVAIGDGFAERFSLLEPARVLDFDILAQAGDETALWRHKASGLRFRGQPLPAKGGLAIALLGAPCLADSAELAEHGLLTEDFPPHAPTVELLQTLQSHKIALQDERDLAEKLSEQRAGLLHANAELSRQFSLLWEELVSLRQIEAETFKIALIANNTGNAVVMTDAQGRVEWVNDSFTQMTGYSLQEMLGKTPGSVLQGENSDPSVIEHIREQIQKGESFGADIINYSKSGREYWVQFEVQPIRDEDDAITNWMAIERDITEQKKSELALLEATRAAEAANRAKSVFLATMSHEIRTPMNAVLGTLSLLLDSQLDEEQGLWAKSAYQAARSLLDIIDDILDFSKIEAGKLTLQNENFVLHSLIENAVELFRMRTEAKGLALSFSIDPDIPRILRGDRFRLRQILVNLIGNAVKFTERGGVFVGVFGLECADSKTKLHFHVQDSGIGIAKEAQESLFNQFVQVDARNSRRYGGTGLGLAISKRLAAMMGGEIGVNSSPGEGSEFWFTAQLELPGEDVDPAEADDENAPPFSARAATAEDRHPAQRPEKAKILVAEDGEINRLVVTAMLGKVGYQVEVAEDGAKAVEAVCASDYDLILMDVQMPEMDGYQATSAIRALPGRKAEVPILAFTANALREDLNACLAVGMNDFVAKPVEKDRLLATIAHWLRKYDGHTRPSSPPASALDALLDPNSLAFLAAQTDEQTLRDTLAIFFEDTARRMGKLAQVSGSRDFQALGFEAHSIKSAAMTIGALRLARCCKNLEAACRDGDGETALRLAQSLERIFEETRSAFAQTGIID
jgi:PAS domain S-box-containing protein